MAKYFKLSEFITSESAVKYKIDNSPSPVIETRIKELMEVLDPIREALGYPITITSGYRCPELNKKIGGASTSGHLGGWTCDMQCKSLTNKEFYMFLRGYFSDKKMDELIIEKSGTKQ